MDEALRTEVFKQIEIAKEIARTALGNITAHERECAVRYAAIEKSMVARETDAAQTDRKLDEILDKANAGAWSANWKAWALAGTLFLAMIGAMGWMSAKLYEYESGRLAPAVSPQK